MSPSDAPVLTITELQFRERDVRLRMPFRFGVTTLTAAPQVFVRARIRLAGGREAWGAAAELLAPKWFDKNLELSNEDNFDQLRTALRIAADAYLGAGRDTAFGLFAGHYQAQIDAGAARHLNPLVASYGPALIDRAVLDALCQACGVSVCAAVQANLPGIAPERLLPEFAGFDMAGFLAGRAAAPTIEVRHTVGMVDPVTDADVTAETRVGDGLPESLTDVIATYGIRYFKLKLGGDLAADLERLQAIAAVLDRSDAPYFATLDGNEQYRDVDGIVALWDAMAAEPALARLVASIGFIEQPIHRGQAFARDVGQLAERRAVIIDESDADLEAFTRARDLGYAGVSSKQCKGLYKALINAARCARWNAETGTERFFMSAEDLTTQAGVSVQQDLALATLVGATHVERNGHHYVNGMAGRPESEQAAFLAAHPGLYHRSHGAVRLAIHNGRLAIASLDCPGYAVAAEPDWDGMRPMPHPAWITWPQI